MPQHFDTIIIGGGQSGLAASYYLQKRGIDHIVLEAAAQPANAWRNERWDSFTLVTPNWSFCMPGAEYQAADPHGFMPRSEIVRTFERYIERFQLPVYYRQKVTSLEPLADGAGYLINTLEMRVQARQVVIASGMFARPVLPAFSHELAPSIIQIQSGKYRHPSALPPGAVLVVGSGQSGGQIAEELYQSGRTVYLSTGVAGRAPRCYRGKDIFEWLEATGFLSRTLERLPSPAARFAANPTVTGQDGGHTLNLHKFARDGVVLLGRLQGGSGSMISLAPNLHENLAKSDGIEAEIIKLIDGYIARNGLDAPSEELPVLRDGFNAPILDELDLNKAGVHTIIWAMGYRPDFSYTRLPLLDESGFPIHQRGVSRHPGLYFVGMPWMDVQKTGILLGVAEHAEFIAGVVERYAERSAVGIH